MLEAVETFKKIQRHSKQIKRVGVQQVMIDSPIK